MQDQSMPDRITYVKHRGKSVMLVDFTNCTAVEMLRIVEEIRDQMARHEPGSVLALADYSGSKINKPVATRIKEVLVLDRPYVKRAAWTGTENLPQVYFENFKAFSRREIRTFKTREEALDWLVSG
jgi:hypothetical protein